MGGFFGEMGKRIWGVLPGLRILHLGETGKGKDVKFNFVSVITFFL